MPHGAAGATAHLDPWLLFVDPHGDAAPRVHLFGWALHHHRLLGLTWVRSSAVLHLDEGAGRARTASGSRYALGRRLVSPEDLSAEGRVAWAGLVTGAATDLERRWIAALKAARWLGVDAPELDGDAVSAFVARHSERYLALRAAVAERRGTA